MATKSKKKQVVTEQVKVVEEVTVQPKMQSIAFDKNSNLYGISDDNRVYRFDFNRKEWLIVWDALAATKSLATMNRPDGAQRPVSLWTYVIGVISMSRKIYTPLIVLIWWQTIVWIMSPWKSLE